MLRASILSLPEIEATNPLLRPNETLILLDHLLKGLDFRLPNDQLTPMERVRRHIGKFSKPESVIWAVRQRNERQHEGDKADLDELYRAHKELRKAVLEVLPYVSSDLATDVRERRNNVEDPWKKVAAKYRAGQVIRVIVKRFGKTQNGDFLALSPN